VALPIKNKMALTATAVRAASGATVRSLAEAIFVVFIVVLIVVKKYGEE
jgi:hypothetical protein